MPVRDPRAVLALFLALCAPAQALAARPQQAPARPAVPAPEARLAAIESAVEAKRAELGVPGASLVIVKDDKIVYLKGLGYRDFEKKVPVTPDTLFAIGSSTKAFVALGVMMTADEGKLTLDDSPKKFLPYFKLQDPEADAKITVRNLLSHNSGLNRTDLAWITGKLTRPEIIEVASRAKPTAKLGEKFQYQNVMFAAAGEIVGRLHGTSWERFTESRILAPLGMKNTNISVEATQKSNDFSYGYEYNHATKATRRLPMRSFPEMSPAGAINSSARDMAQWLRFMLAGGAIDGKRLVSQKSFDELVTTQMKIGGKTGYGLGWFVRDWHGHKLLEHAGNIDGFNAQVAFMPDQSLGMVLLTNVSASSLPQTAMEAVWANLVGDPDATAAAPAPPGPAAEASAEAGSYLLKEANLTMTIALRDGKLFLEGAPGQPPYELTPVSGRRYKLAAVDGFFVTFRPAKDNPADTEMYLEQPQGNVTLARVKASPAPDPAASGALRELVGRYENDKGGGPEIAEREGKVSLVVAGQPPYALFERGKDVYGAAGLPDAYRVAVKRDGAGRVAAIVLEQPQGNFEFRRAAEFSSPLTAEELMAKVVEAQGGEANLRRHKTMVATAELDFENQGVTAEGRVASKAPDRASMSMTLKALGKEIGWAREYFDGSRGVSETSFSDPEVKAGKELEEARLGAQFYGYADWKSLYKSAEVRKMAKVGDEDCYVVVLTPPTTQPVTLYVSARSFRVLKRDSFTSSETNEMSLPQTESYSDFRTVDGVVLPFTTVQSSVGMGDVVLRYKDVKFDVEVADSLFAGK